MSEAGEPYEARSSDRFGNLCIHFVTHPQLNSCYFKYSKKVNSHYQVHQFDLAVEKIWVTQDAYFKSSTTEVGFNTVDAWDIFLKYRKQGTKFSTVTQFVDMLVYQMMQFSNISEEGNILSFKLTVEEKTLAIASISNNIISSTHKRICLP